MPTKTTKKTYTPAERQRLEEINDLVSKPENVERFQNADTAADIHDIAEDLGLDLEKGSGDIPKLVVALRTIQVDLPAMAKAQQAELIAELYAHRKDYPAVRLAAAAIQDPNEADNASFAVVDKHNRAVIYGKLFDNDFERIWVPGDAATAEQSAADKAVYVAYKARLAAGATMATLYLTTTYPELDIDALQAAGKRMGLAVDVEVNHEHEAAVIQAGTTGYRAIGDCRDADLAALVESPESDEDDEDDDTINDGDGEPTGHRDENQEG